MLVRMAEHPYHHGDLRAALLKGAEHTLREKGASALSLRELARSIGVSHAAPSRHFKDKQALLDALALSGFQRLTLELRQSATDGGTQAVLTALARAYVGFATVNPELLEVMYARKHEPNASEQLTEAVDQLVEAVVRPIADGQAAGDIVPGDTMGIAMVVAATLHGIASFAANGALTPEAVADILDDAVHHLLRGLTPR